MKIAVWYNLPFGGAKRALYYHVRGLVERGHTVEVWCPPTVDQTYLPLSQFIPEHLVPLDDSPCSSPNLIYRALWDVRAAADRLKALHAHCRQCAYEIDRSGFDLLFANNCVLSAASPISRYARTPSVLYLQEPYRIYYEAQQLHDMPQPRLLWANTPSDIGAWWKPSSIKKSLKNIVRVQGVRMLACDEAENAQAYRAILVNSFYSRESVLRIYGIDAKVCYLGVDTNLFHDQSQDRQNYVIGLGVIRPYKNIKFVLEALAAIPKQRPRLVWVGNMVDEDYLEELKQFACSRQVEFEPKVLVSDAELVDLLNRAALMVYAPLLEPFGLAPLEANACGTPVVGIAEGGVRESIQDGRNGLLVEPDPRAMTAGIQRLLNDQAYAAQLGRNGRQWVTDYWSLAASTDRLEARFADALEKTPL